MDAYNLHLSLILPYFPDLSRPHALDEHFPPNIHKLKGFPIGSLFVILQKSLLLPVMLLSIPYIADFSLYALLLSRQPLLEEEQL